MTGPATREEGAAAAEVAAAIDVGASVALGAEHWHLSLRFAPEVLKNGMDPLAFLRYLQMLGEIVHIETLGRGYTWTAEARTVHHTSHAPRASH